MAGRSAHAVIGAVEVRRDEIVEAVVRAVVVRAAEAAIGDERVDGAVLGCCGCEGVVHLRALADVAGGRAGAELVRDGT